MSHMLRKISFLSQLGHTTVVQNISWLSFKSRSFFLEWAYCYRLNRRNILHKLHFNRRNEKKRVKNGDNIDFKFLLFTSRELPRSDWPIDISMRIYRLLIYPIILHLIYQIVWLHRFETKKQRFQKKREIHSRTFFNICLVSVIRPQI